MFESVTFNNKYFISLIHDKDLMYLHEGQAYIVDLLNELLLLF